MARVERNVNRLFEPIGGMEACRLLSKRFHVLVEADDVLRPIFPLNMAMLEERFAVFLGEQIGGPKDYTAKRGKTSLLCRHAHLSISTAEADCWLRHMSQAMQDVGIEEPHRNLLGEFFVATAKTLTDPYIPFYKLPLEELRAEVNKQPDLLRESSNGHSLLMDAILNADLPRVETLLELGASANAEAPLQHGPLYRAANAVGGATRIVELLTKHGADVNWPSGLGKCTPLHMAARRGNVSIAEVLLKSGANIEHKDSKGETPLRRAVNCGQEEMVAFLLSCGADKFSQDKRGMRPVDVARTERNRLALSPKS